jgi:hypothetical protein
MRASSPSCGPTSGTYPRGRPCATSAWLVPTSPLRAVQLGEHQQFDPKDRHSPDLCCGRTKFALKVAAANAEHPEPDDLARLGGLAKSLAPFKDPKPLAAVL